MSNPMENVPSEHQEDIANLKAMLGLDENGKSPELDLELRTHIVTRTGGAQFIMHPLVHQMYIPMQNGMYNNALKKKREIIAEEEAEGGYDALWRIIFLAYERPYRFEAFDHYAEQMDDKTYWSLLGEIWTDSENIWQNIAEWREHLSSERPCREYIMNGPEVLAEDDGKRIEGTAPPVDERALFEALPDTIKVYRGTNAADLKGSMLSWTTEKESAQWFARRLPFARQPYLITGTVEKKDVIAYFHRRTEHEILVFPEKVQMMKTRPISRKG